MIEKRYRFEALDALRGLAILMMVFSANIPFEGALPGWMYHAQVPPPLHQFQPDLPGITWVDLVFPFFLFCMGAAIPFSFGGKIEKGYRGRLMGRDLLIRFGGLALFAIVSQHARPWVMNVDEGAQWPLALLAMIGMVLLFASPSSGWWSRHRQLMRIIGLLILIALFGALHYFDRVTFRLQRFDIIIMVLANNALAGALLYLLHRKYKQTLWISFALLCAFFLSGRAGDNWIAALYHYSPLPWLLSWNYLKYLLVTAGLALFALFAFTILIDLLKCGRGLFLLSGSGKNAMLAYIAGSNLILPLLHLTGIARLFRLDGYSTTLHTIEAVLVTLLVAWVSAVAAKKRFFLKV